MVPYGNHLRHDLKRGIKENTVRCGTVSAAASIDVGKAKQQGSSQLDKTNLYNCPRDPTASRAETSYNLPSFLTTLATHGHAATSANPSRGRTRLVCAAWRRQQKLAEEITDVSQHSLCEGSNSVSVDTFVYR